MLTRSVHVRTFFILSGVIGTGTMILSKWPILETKFRKFTLNGFKHQVWYGDALAGSGIGLVKLMIGSPQNHLLVNVYVSHYHAEYNRANDAHKVTRVEKNNPACNLIYRTRLPRLKRPPRLVRPPE